MTAEDGAVTTHERAWARHRRTRIAGRVLVFLASVVALLAAAAPGMADPIDQIQINGAAPNADGSGLQVSATFDGAVVTVTNNSSSYTDIKEIDGQANPTQFGIAGATTQPYASTCNVGGGPGGSFSCPGLSIPPGQSGNVFLLSTVGGALANGLASVNVIYDSIEVNGKPMDPHGKGLQVTAITKKGSCPDLGKASAWCLTVNNSPNSGSPMTAVTGIPNTPPAGGSAAQVSDVHAGFGFGSDTLGCGLEQGGFACPAPFGVSPQVYGFDFTDSSFSAGLGDIQVTFQSTPCANNARASFGPAIARAAADKCTPPSHTKITQAKINQKKHTAFFKFTAKRTKKFTCALLRNGQRIFYSSCHSPKPYANKLKKGKYVFYVDGTNQGGTDPHPAKKTFTLK